MAAAPALALFLPDLSGGGAERMMVNLARGFVERNVPVDLVLVNRSGPYLQDVPQAVRVLELASSGVIAGIPALVRYLRRSRPEALLATLDHASVAAVWSKHLARVTTRVFVREANVLARGNSGGLRESLIPYAIRASYPRADGIVAVSEGVAASVIRHAGVPRSKVHTIYNPVVSDDLRELSREPVDHPWFGPSSAPVVLAAGRLVAQKDFATLVRAFSIVRASAHARLVILGEGAEREALRSLAMELGISDDVDLPGFVDNPFKYMARASVFVLSSAWEGLPSVLVQAMACGCPVVSTDCAGGGPREILEGGLHGPLVPVGDPHALGHALREVLAAGVDRGALRARADAFSVERAVAQYLELMLGLPS